MKDIRFLRVIGTHLQDSTASLQKKKRYFDTRHLREKLCLLFFIALLNTVLHILFCSLLFLNLKIVRHLFLYRL